MKKDDILEKLIEEKDYESAIKNIEEKINELLIKKFDYKNEKYNDNSMELLEYCIKNYYEYYDLLTFIRNTYFFNEKNIEEKLFDLLNIYDVLQNL